MTTHTCIMCSQEYHTDEYDSCPRCGPQVDMEPPMFHVNVTEERNKHVHLEIRGLDGESFEEFQGGLLDLIQQFGEASTVRTHNETLSMTECDGCGFTDVRSPGTDCPRCEGTMRGDDD